MSVSLLRDLAAAAAKKKPSGAAWMVTKLQIVTGTGDVFDDGALVVSGERLKAVGKTADLVQRFPNIETIDGTGFVAVPGLVNAHTHCAMGFFRGLAHDQENMIEDFFFPLERSLSAELTEPLAYSYLVDGLKSGVTTFGDHYYFVDGIGRAADKLGVRAAIGETIADLGGAFPGLASFERLKKALDRWPHSSRITPVVAPHAADTVSEALLTELAAFAKANDLPLHMHLAQTAGEHQRVTARAGATPVQVAERTKALGPKTLAVHLVAVDDDDVKRLAASGATAGVCAASQMLYEHLAPIGKFLHAKIPVALGTDCAASNDSADLMAEMKLYALLTKDRRAPAEACTPLAALRAASLGGARALGLGTELGSLEAGKAADVVFLEPDVGALPAPRPDVNLVYSLHSRHVRHVMVAGRFALVAGKPALASEADMTAAYLQAVTEIRRRVAR